MRTLLLFVLAAASIAGVAPAQLTFFVDGLNGSDTNPGTSRVQAFKSITFAAGLAATDDRIIVLPATYSPTATGEVYPIQFGDSTKPGPQNNVTIVGEEGPAATILDGEQQMTSSGVPMLRFRGDATGSSITGFTFTNTGSASFWSMCIRLGSTSGGNFATTDIEVHGNVFQNVHRAVVVFGTDPTGATPNQTTGCKIHDNLIESASGRALALWGDGLNSAYNNTIVNGGPDAIWVDNVWTPPSATLVANNLVVNGANGFNVGPNGTTATFLNNNAFGNTANYVGMTYGPSNTSFDPLFVNAAGGDYHLQATSPILQQGTRALPIVRHDLDRMSRAHDSDGNGSADVDVGCYQYAQWAMQPGGIWAPGQTAQFVFTGNPGGALVFVGFGDAAFRVQALGVFMIDPALLLPFVFNGSIPGTIPVPIPASPSLLGAPIVFQGALFPLHLLNAHRRTL